MSSPSDLRRAIPTTTLRLETSRGPCDSAVQIIVAIWAAYKECNVRMCSDGAFPSKGVISMAAGGGGRGRALGCDGSRGGAGRRGVVGGMDACIFFVTR